MMQLRQLSPDNGDGWTLDIRHAWDPERLDPDRPAVLLVPGYGMNTHVLGYHPEGPSLMEFLTSRGYEVFAANLRGQGRSVRYSGTGRIGLAELTLTDLPRVLQTVHAERQVRPERLHAIGASLGASLLYAWIAHHPADHGFASLVSIGGPLRWDRVHPLVRLVFASPAIAGRIRITGVRRLARVALPLVRRFPRLLGLYMNADMIDLSRAADLVETVDDPHPHLNRQLAHWLRGKDLTVAGVDVSRALAQVDLPVLCVLANADGIVPPEAVLSVKHVMRRARVEVLPVGDEEVWFAHADLFVSRHAQAAVFTPLCDWLARQDGPPAP